MKTLSTAIILLAVLLSSCATKQTIIPDVTIPHRIAEKVTVKIWLRVGDTDEMQEVEMEFLPNWWLIPPSWHKAAKDAAKRPPE